MCDRYARNRAVQPRLRARRHLSQRAAVLAHNWASLGGLAAGIRSLAPFSKVKLAPRTIQ